MILPVSFLAAGIIMVLVARYDENLKVCPIQALKSSKSSRRSNQKTWTAFPEFCGQTMNPRVTTCCRVPCFQNFTTYFDFDGHPADCVSQPFEMMYLAVPGFVFLVLGGLFLMVVVLEHVGKIKSKTRNRSIIENTFNLPNRFPPVTDFTTPGSPQRVDQEAIPDIGEDSAAAHAFATAASDGEVQVV